MPDDFVASVSPATLLIKQRIKLPLVMICLSAGILSAFTQVFFKYFGEARLAEGRHYVLAGSLLVAGCISGVIQLLAVNVGMKYYN